MHKFQKVYMYTCNLLSYEALLGATVTVNLNMYSFDWWIDDF